MNRVFVFVCLLITVSTIASAQLTWVDDLDLSSMETGWGRPQATRSVDGNLLSIGGKRFERGIGTHASSTFLLNLDGTGEWFFASVGVDDEAKEKASVEFMVLADKKVLWRSGIMKKGDPAKLCEVSVVGTKLLGLLVTDGGDGIDYDHADWADARIEMLARRPAAEMTAIPGGPSSVAIILTPKPADAPRINSARVFGVRPGHPFLYTIAATGKRPMTFEAKNLPTGLAIDQATGRITGTVKTAGRYLVRLIASNALGSADRDLRIEVGGRIALTPPMGWNSWNCWACAVDDQKVRASAEAMVSSGLVDHGWTYINIDDCWEIKPDATEENVKGAPRDATGMINTNKKFPDMKSLADFVHSKGLKIGIYSSPGPLTCAGFTASYQHEEHDARRYAEWGIDYLKYDWCSYGRIAPKPSLEDLKKPYRVMRAALDKVERDIVYSLCQYGMGKVWEWGGEVGGNCWRTTGDIEDSWSSMSRIGFGQAGHEVHAKPGNWNDPDMLVVGLVGWGPDLHPTRLKPDEQYTHISLWCLLASPLLIGCDLSRLDDFTLSLLTNDEVLDVNQDPVGKQARRIKDSSGTQVWMKEMEDGSKAVGLFNVGIVEAKDPADHFRWEGGQKARITVTAAELGLSGTMRVRDLWRQQDLGSFDGSVSADVPYHGVVLVRIKKGL
jgi:alpha-galactosidase